MGNFNNALNGASKKIHQYDSWMRQPDNGALVELAPFIVVPLSRTLLLHKIDSRTTSDTCLFWWIHFANKALQASFICKSSIPYFQSPTYSLNLVSAQNVGGHIHTIL